MVDGSMASQPGDPNLRALTQELVKLKRDIRRMPDVQWATVTSLDPLRIRIDGDSAPLLSRPSTVVDVGLLSIGDRVHVTWKLAEIVIIGRAGGSGSGDWAPLPLGSGIQAYSGITPQWKIEGGKFKMRGAVARSPGGFTTSYVVTLAAGAVPAKYRNDYHSVRLYPSAAGSPPGRGYVDSTGALRLATTSGTASYYVLNAELDPV